MPKMIYDGKERICIRCGSGEYDNYFTVKPDGSGCVCDVCLAKERAVDSHYLYEKPSQGFQAWEI